MNLVREPDEWRSALSSINRYDIYHTYDYHRLAAGPEAGDPILIDFEDKGVRILLPLLLRVDEIAGRTVRDLTSVYGYCGPVTSGKPLEPGTVRGFRHGLCELLQDLGAVTVFSRLHPLLTDRSLLQGCGTVEHAGRTVSMDPTLDQAEKWAKYGQNLRRNLRKLQRAEVECSVSTDESDFSDFSRIYYETMRRRGASEQYFFPVEYFEALKRAADFDTHLFVCRIGEETIGGGLFLSSGDIVQYHLGATRTEFTQLSPSILMFDTVREWAGQRGFQSLHLGGGVGGANDSLFRFKRRFADLEHDFYLWRWIVDPENYQSVCERYKKQLSEKGLKVGDNHFFPAYRAPAG